MQIFYRIIKLTLIFNVNPLVLRHITFKIKNYEKNLLLVILSSLIIFSCKTTEPTVIKSSQKEVTSLSLTGIANATSTFDQATNTYTFTVPIGTNIKALALTFTLPTGATSVPTSGSTQDFTNPVYYTITAEDGSKQIYKILVNIQSAPKSSEKEILEFSFKSLNPVVKATIDQTNKKITAEVPSSTDITKLIPTILISPKATVTPASDIVQNFSNTVSYEVTAEDGSKQKYEVQITKAVISSKFPDYGFNGSKLKSIEFRGNIVANYDYLNNHLNSISYFQNSKLQLVRTFTYTDIISTFIESNSEYIKYSFKNDKIDKISLKDGEMKTEFQNNLLSKLSFFKKEGKLERILTYQYDNNKNIIKVEFRDANQKAVVTIEMLYDSKRNYFGSTYDDYLNVMFNVLTGTNAFSIPFIPASQNVNNVISYKIISSIDSYQYNAEYSYKYNSNNYPIECIMNGTETYDGKAEKVSQSFKISYY
jgi:hypothetical protein